MQQSFSKLVRKYALLQCIVPLLFFSLAIYLLFFSNFSRSFSPEKIHSLSEIRQLSEIQPQTILLSDMTLHYTGYDYMENNKLCGAFYYTFEDDTCYFFLLNLSDTLDRKDTLTLSSLQAVLVQDETSYHDLTAKLAADLAWSVDDVEEIAAKQIISPYHAKHSHLSLAFLFLCIGIAVTILPVFYYLFLFAFPFYQFQARPFRSYDDLTTLAKTCEQQIQEGNVFLADTIYILPDAFCSVNEQAPAIIPISEIMWIYKHSTFHHLTIMPAKLTYTIHIMTKKGKHYHFKGFSKQTTSSILQYMDDHYSDMLIGYSERKQSIVHHRLTKET